jgi:hypothetical protein
MSASGQIMEQVRTTAPTRSAATPRREWLLALLGLASFAVGLAVAPERTWAQGLLVSFGLLTLALFGGIFLALHYLSGARWSTPLVCLAEALAGLLPLATAGMGVVLVAGVSLYPPPGEEAGLFRQQWLERPFLLARAALYGSLWLVLTRGLVRASRQADADRGRAARWSAAFLIVFGITFWLASYDWIMALEPDWASTIFPLYQFAGLYLGGIALLIVLALGPPRQRLAALGLEQRHDLGKLLFAFSSFWMYIWYCQYLLIWYVNNPEETHYYTRRLQGGWEPLVLVNVLLNWLVPFVVLLPQKSKRSSYVLVRVAAVVLAGRVLDLYLAIFPPVVGAVPAWGLVETGMLVGAAALGLAVIRRGLGNPETSQGIG